jgi:hypothetical protein
MLEASPERAPLPFFLALDAGGQKGRRDIAVLDHFDYVSAT